MKVNTPRRWMDARKNSHCCSSRILGAGKVTFSVCLAVEPSLPLPNSPNPFFLGGQAGRRSRSQVNAAVVSQSFVVLPSAVQRETNQSAGHEAAHRTLGYFLPLVRCTMLLKITGDFFRIF
jgi:hypothetical protein